MAYVDERTQKFIDNIINGSSNEELFKMQRNPAAKPFVGPPSEAQDVPVVAAQNVQPAVEISPTERIRPLEISMPALVKQTPDYMSNVNRSIEGLSNLKSQYAQERQLTQEQYDQNQAQIKSALENLNKAAQPRVRTPQENARLLAAQDNLKNIKDAPERDMLSEAIVSFAPALLGSLTGESGALAAPTAAKQSRELYEAGRKQDIEAINKKNEQIRKNYENILKIDKQSAEDYLNNQKLMQQQADVAFKGAATLGQMTQKQMGSYDDKIAKLSQLEAEGTQKGAKEIVDIEMTPGKEAAKTNRAKIIGSGQGLKDATNLRKEFNDDPIVKNFKLITEANEKIQTSSDNPIGHLSAITGYAKIIDPGNAVKEGEFKNVEQARAFFTRASENGIAVPSFVLAALNQMQGKGKLLPEQLRELKREARILYNSQQKLVAEKESEYLGYASEYKTRPELVIPKRSKPAIVDEPKETRVQKLDKLLKAGSITQEQYNKFKAGK